jgi:F-type H+-transporting ATPase subunit alpha
MAKTLKNPTFEILEVGEVQSVQKAIIIADGLPSCMNNQLVEFEGGIRGLVMGFTKDKVQILVLGQAASIHAGDKIYNKAGSLSLPVGKNFLGRAVNSLCEPTDGLGPIEHENLYPVFREAPGVMDRVPVDEALETGTTSIDAIIPIGKGQRQLLIGDRSTGKTNVGLDAFLNQKEKDVICIYCSIGQPHVRLTQVMDFLRDKEILSYTIVVSGIASMPIGLQYLAPYTAGMIGEYFMHHGRDVLIVFDDLTKHAWAYRQISLLLERAPGREAYPGDIFYIHSQLIERAGRLNPEAGGGSMTFLPIVEILQGDVTGYIPTNLISMTDGQIYFNTALFKKGIKPPVDFGLSVSRIGNKAQWPGMRELSGDLRLGYLRYQELLQMSQLRVMAMSKELGVQLKHGQAIEELIKQDKNKPVAVEKQLIYLYALNLRVLDNLTSVQIKKFKDDIPKFVKKHYPGLIAKIQKSKLLSDSVKKKLDECLKEYFEVSKND